MFKLFAAFRKDRIWDFAGGIHPPEMKTQSSQVPLRQAPIPDYLIIPLKQHLGPEGDLCVNVGDKVLRGQPLTRGFGRMLPVHAPTSGTVHAIRQHMSNHPSGLTELSIIIIPDGLDRWCERRTLTDYRQATPSELVEHLHQAGIAGLGGAGFPTAAKLQGGLRGIETLIINAAECEPYITADDRLMQECAQEIAQGVDILDHLLQPQRILLGIEDNKPEAIRALRVALVDYPRIQMRVIPTKYPSGGAKQLTRILTGKEVPFGKHSASIGVLMQNVGTAYAIKRAVIDGEPLTERVVTLTGDALRQPGNVWVRLGTPVRHLLRHAGYHVTTTQPMVIMGGPLMGFTLPALDVPIIKTSNCILAPARDEIQVQEEEQACIRCSKCADACPAGLLPQQLYWFSRGQEHEKARQHHLFDCIECGACAYVCPSNIPLVQYYRQEKAEIQALDQESRKAAEAKARFDARQARLEREKRSREERHKQAAASVAATDKSAVMAALERVRNKQATAVKPDIRIEPGQLPDNSTVIAAREARKAQLRERQAEKALDTTHDNTPKAAVAAAIARVQARQAEAMRVTTVDITTSGITTTDAETSDANDKLDPRKAAIAAAIARVKARKAAHSDHTEDADSAEYVTTSQELSPSTASASPESRLTAASGDVPQSDSLDPRKAAVAAAIARVKARKTALSHSTEQADSTGQADNTENVTTSLEASPLAAVTAPDSDLIAAPGDATQNDSLDPRKAAVAAAIARVKARKAAALSASQED
ncbi:electron transport complex subunit RsxC [Dickeya zeae]|uniref:electron transport complex subunit RsxC n=1 Tax=Dickeya zeae TaxID=204042 RepID=UPI000C9BB15E|nr:electron transport complex subunit RsxC [Dickeya zeae]AUQ25492.1 electron transport complex subunit RsxC [Dickeya zeae]UJR58568.1 electron transport complex subunit RsxC [Dickeya zeae]